MKNFMLKFIYILTILLLLYKIIYINVYLFIIYKNYINMLYVDNNFIFKILIIINDWIHTIY